jgi:hypothetical protein
MKKKELEYDRQSKKNKENVCLAGQKTASSSMSSSVDIFPAISSHMHSQGATPRLPTLVFQRSVAVTEA